MRGCPRGETGRRRRSPGMARMNLKGGGENAWQSRDGHFEDEPQEIPIHGGRRGARGGCARNHRLWQQENKRRSPEEPPVDHRVHRADGTSGQAGVLQGRGHRGRFHQGRLPSGGPPFKLGRFHRLGYPELHRRGREGHAGEMDSRPPSGRPRDHHP